MKRKPCLIVWLQWVHIPNGHRTHGTYELRPIYEDDPTTARISPPEFEWKDDTEVYEFVIKHPNPEYPGFLMKGQSPDLQSCCGLAEAAVINQGWWPGKTIRFDRSQVRK